MPLYRVTFEEAGGYKISCRIRADALADHRWLAMRKIWGEQAVWVPLPGTQQGRVCRVQTTEQGSYALPLTAWMTVTIEQAPQRRWSQLAGRSGAEGEHQQREPGEED